MNPLVKTFEVDGLRYRLNISEEGTVTFHLTGGGTRRGSFRPHLFFDDEESLDDVNLLTVSPIKVFVCVKNQVIEWVKRERPYQLSFQSSNIRRFPIYRSMSERLARELPQYFAYELGLSFQFFRQVDEQLQSGIHSPDPESPQLESA